jgi:hypothetical protein
MLVTGTLGGYLGARVARQLPAALIRGFVILIGTVLTIYYFGKTT